MKYLYKKFAKYYDSIYSEKDYSKETKFMMSLIKRHKIKGKNILEIGCGTGNHAIHLQKKGFNIIGVDLNKEMLSVARAKTKKIRFIQGDMKSFNLKKQFDIILCLFSTIHYNQNIKQLEKTLINFHKHLKTGGLLIFDMGFNNEIWRDNNIQIKKPGDKKMQIMRYLTTKRKDNIGILYMGYMLFKDGKFSFGEEQHFLGIFKTLKVKSILSKIGFQPELYENYTPKLWTPKSKKYVVFAGVKTK